MGKLDGKVALVTGSGRGFGRAMAIAYAKEGAKVIGASRTKRELDGMVKTAKSMGGEAIAISMDLSKENEIYKLRDQVLDRYGRLDILVNNAATSLWKTVEGMSLAEWDFTIAVNLRAPYVLAQTFLDTMKKQGSGNIINVTSRSAEVGFAAEIGYCPSKFGIEGLTQCLALELKTYNIAVNSLNVGAPEGRRLKPTELTLQEAEEMPEDVKSRYATDEELVEAFTDAWTFLAIQDGYGVSGQRLGTKQIAEYLKRYGWEAATANWSKKLTQAVYVTYDWPKSVRYQTPEGGIKELKFY